MKRFVQFQAVTKFNGDWEISDEDYEFLKMVFTENQINESFARVMCIRGGDQSDWWEIISEIGDLDEEDVWHRIREIKVTGLYSDRIYDDFVRVLTEDVDLVNERIVIVDDLFIKEYDAKRRAWNECWDHIPPADVAALNAARIAGS